MAKAQVMYTHRRSVQLTAPEVERDRKRSAPPATTAFVDETPRTRKTNSRRSSVQSREAAATPRKVPLAPPPQPDGYLNPAFVGSVNSVRSVSAAVVVGESQNTVFREQYCSCARWSRLEQLLVLAVSVLAGIVAGLIIVVALMALRGEDVPSSILRRATTTMAPLLDPSGS